PQGGNRIGDVTLRPQRRSLGVGNPWERQIPRSELWQQVVRGERLPSRRPGSHKPPPSTSGAVNHGPDARIAAVCRGSRAALSKREDQWRELGPELRLSDVMPRCRASSFSPAAGPGASCQNLHETGQIPAQPRAGGMARKATGRQWPRDGEPPTVRILQPDAVAFRNARPLAVGVAVLSSRTVEACNVADDPMASSISRLAAPWPTERAAVDDGGRVRVGHLSDGVGNIGVELRRLRAFPAVLAGRPAAARKVFLAGSHWLVFERRP